VAYEVLSVVTMQGPISKRTHKKIDQRRKEIQKPAGEPNGGNWEAEMAVGAAHSYNSGLKTKLPK
jgi:hypothetical protein